MSVYALSASGKESRKMIHERIQIANKIQSVCFWATLHFSKSFIKIRS